jgi:hypothetical protein
VDLLLITAQATTPADAAAQDGLPIPVAVLTAVKEVHDAEAGTTNPTPAHQIKKQSNARFIRHTPPEIRQTLKSNSVLARGGRENVRATCGHFPRFSALRASDFAGLIYELVID